jgi:hypothetical protein
MALVAYLGLQYSAVLRDMERAARLYSQGDLEAALKTYDGVEQRLRAHGTMRLIPADDRQTLLLNQARLLYALNRYDEATERLAREDEISGVATDPRFFLLRGNISYRRARQTYDQTSKVDLNTINLALNVFQDGLAAAEDSYRESLQLNPDNWDAKYNFEFIRNMRRIMGSTSQEKLNMLEQERAPEIQLPPDLVG